MTQRRSRAAGRTRRTTAGLLAALGALGACARQEAPPGGEIDRIPPVVAAVRPEALSTVEPSRDPIVVEFNERISERLAGGTLQDAVTVSPLTGETRVGHSRNSLEIEVVGGLQPGVVYRVTVRPVVRDMFNNTMREPFEFGFSTGGEFHETALAGLVVDRLTGQPMHDLVVRVEDQARPAGDPLVHLARTDSGVYTLRWLPPGAYRVVAFQDRNRDMLVDSLEIQGSRDLVLGAADTVFLDFPVMEPDTTPAQLTRAEIVDSLTLRLTFSDYLDPDVPPTGVGAAVERQEGGGAVPDVGRVLHEHEWVAIRTPQDTTTGADSVGAAPDSVPSVPPGVPAQPVDTFVMVDSARADRPQRPAAQGPTFTGRAQGADSAAAALLGLALPSRVLYAELTGPLEPGVGYVLRIQGVRNLAGLLSGTDSARFTRPAPDPPPPPPGLEASGPTSRRPIGTAGAEPGLAIPGRREAGPPRRR